MSMVTQFSLRYEGAPACVDCQRTGLAVCAHVGFNTEAWDGLVGQGVHAPGLDHGHSHVLRGYEISLDRKTISLTVDTERPPLTDLARHLSLIADVRPKANVRAVHHETGDVIEEGHYDAFLRPGQQVCVDRQLYHVASVEHPNRDPVAGAVQVPRDEHGNFIGDGPPDIQVARLMPIDPETVQGAT